MSFAERTMVPVERTRAEIEKLIVTKYQAKEFGTGLVGSTSSIQFVLQSRRVRFDLLLPDTDWARDEVMGRKRCRYYYRESIPTSKLGPLVDAEHRRRWRCLLLMIKAKLEMVDSGIATFDEEFLAHIVIENRTLMDRISEMEMGGGRPLLPPVQ